MLLSSHSWSQSIIASKKSMYEIKSTEINIKTDQRLQHADLNMQVC